MAGSCPVCVLATELGPSVRAAVPLASEPTLQFNMFSIELRHIQLKIQAKTDLAKVALQAIK